jgi:hypothetical protein
MKNSNKHPIIWMREPYIGIKILLRTALRSYGMNILRHGAIDLGVRRILYNN